MGEDSVRYDFFYALQKTKNLHPWELQLEYPIHINAFIPNKVEGSKRNEKPQIDLLVNNHDFKICAEFAMFRRNSNPDSDIAVTENTIKMLNDFVRLALQSYYTNSDAYFVCVADAKMLEYQLNKIENFPVFPGKKYRISFDSIESIITKYKSGKKFDMRFVSKKQELLLEIEANLVFEEQINSTLNPLLTKILIWKIVFEKISPAFPSVQLK